MTSFNGESFCPEAWSQIEIDPMGDFKICCLANDDGHHGLVEDANGVEMNIMTHSIYEALNSETHKSHRLLLKQNIQPERCKTCYATERASKGPNDNGYSKRMRVVKTTTPSIPEYVTVDTAEKYTNADGSVTSKIVNLDLRFGNICNFKCLMCSPTHSSLWAEDYKQLFKYYVKGQNKYEINVDRRGKADAKVPVRWWETDTWWKQFDELIPTLRYIYFTGGEPLLVPAMGECLDKLIAAGVAKDIELRYDTNLSVVNMKIIDRWKHFKKLWLQVSIDDTEDRFELIRNPGKYNVIIENLKKLKENNIPIDHITACIGVASPYVISRILPLADEFECNTYFRYLEGPSWLNVKYLPKGAKKEIIAKLRLMAHFCPDHHKNAYQTEINHLNNFMEDENIKHMKEFVRVMDKLDEIRNQNWKNVLPDVYNLLLKHCPEVFDSK